MQSDLHALAKEFTDGKLSQEEFLYRRAKIICTITAPGTAKSNSSSEISAIEDYESKHLIPKLAEEHQLTEEKVQRNHRLARNGLFATTTAFLLISAFYVIFAGEPVAKAPTIVRAMTPQNVTPVPSQQAQFDSLQTQLHALTTRDQWNADQLLLLLHTWNSATIKERQDTAVSENFLQFKDELLGRVYANTAPQQYNEVEMRVMAELVDEVLRYNKTPAIGGGPLGSNSLAKNSASTTKPTTVKSRPSKGRITQTASANISTPVTATTGSPSKKSNSTVASDSRTITTTDLDYLVAQYQTAFENGDKNLLERILSDDNTGMARNEKAQTLNKFSQLIASTKNRKMSFSPWRWNKQGKVASGNSQVQVVMQNQFSGDTEKLFADVFINVTKQTDELVISKMRWDNIDYQRQSGNGIQNVSHSQNNAVAKPVGPVELPSDNELKLLIAQFIDAYEIGDADTFANLFTENVVTNDQNNRQGILQEYSDLFAQTADRKMYIRDLDWSFRNNKAVGKARIEVHVRPNAENNTRKFEGKVEIVSGKYGDQVLISRLFHSLQ